MTEYRHRMPTLVIAVAILVITSAQAAAQTSAVGRTEPPKPPVIFLHYDYMAAPWWDPAQGNSAPDPAVIDRVVEAFRRHGITLIIDPQHTEIPFRDWLFFGPVPSSVFLNCIPTVCANFFDLKNDYFNPHGHQAWHYVIFGYRGLDSAGQLVGGIAQLPGYDFMVTTPFPRRTCFFGTQLDFCQDRVAGTFMHELGHNLGLRHGGDVDDNYKLNYVSVMNYGYQSGILFAAPGDDFQFGTWFGSPPVTESEHIAGIRLDYSDSVFPTLDESHLDEHIGIGGPANSTDVTYYFACGATLSLPCKAGYIRVASAAFDWNNDGIIDTDIAADINYEPNATGELFLSRMVGYDDWAHVHEFLRTPFYLAGTLRPIQIIADPAIPVGTGTR